MTRTTDTWLAATAPAIWGSTYIVTTLMLPDGYPLTIAMLRALPAGLILLVLVRQLPPVEWLGKVMILGALNFTIFWALLFVAANRLPGGVAVCCLALQDIKPMLHNMGLHKGDHRARFKAHNVDVHIVA